MVDSKSTVVFLRFGHIPPHHLLNCCTVLYRESIQFTVYTVTGTIKSALTLAKPCFGEKDIQFLIKQFNKK